ncbi:MAG: glycosyltransferase [Acinetobacter sp.]|nr:glycosyltransferase [Acinetobacter sp.]
MLPTFSSAKSQWAHRLESLLLICFYDPNGISTVPETVSCIQKCSKFSVIVLNLFEHGKNGLTLSLSPSINLRNFDGICIHNSISYNVDNLRSLDVLLNFKIRDFMGVKILMKQDENFKFKELAEYIGETKFDLIFTCLPSEALPIIYPKAVVGTPVFSRMLTGYVTPTLRSFSLNTEPRPIDIGYRGSIQPLSFGRLAYEKRKVGEDVAKLMEGKNLNANISSRWEDRFGSNAWLDFLATCKATLGVESGASIFDLDDTLVSLCAAAEKKYGPIREDAEYAEQFLSALKDIEGKIHYNQISPRHFEAAATRTLQIMYPGSYSNIFTPGRHFIELARDYSNIEQVFALLSDDTYCLQMVNRAYEEIINNPKYWIETFVQSFDKLISRILNKKGIYLKPEFIIGRKKKNLLLLCGHKPSLDPRLEWISKGMPPELQVTQLGVLPTKNEDFSPISLEDGRLILAKPRVSFTSDMLQAWFASQDNHLASWAGLSEINYLFFALTLDKSKLSELFGAPLGSERLKSFKWYVQYILDTTATLVSQVSHIRGYGAIIATDLDTLSAALIIKGMTGVPVIYDAHEYWPEADVAAFEFEKAFWSEMERRLVQSVDYCQTVSPGLAKRMSEQYGREFHFVPNCEPITAKGIHTGSIRKFDGTCHFIFQGNFAEKRGLDLLIDAWSLTDPRAILILRGPDNNYKEKMIERARQVNLLGTRIKFVAPVNESQLVSAAQHGDVALIPYTPFGANYSHCCPNKASQYMAAGLPILANNTSFVKKIIEDSKAGFVIDFSNPHEIKKIVLWFIDNPDLRLEMGRKGVAYFENKFNWNQVSKCMYAAIESLVSNMPVEALRVFPRGAQQNLYSSVLIKTISIPKISLYPFLRLIQKVWKLLPNDFRLKFAPKICKLRSLLKF